MSPPKGAQSAQKRRGVGRTTRTATEAPHGADRPQQSPSLFDHSPALTPAQAINDASQALADADVTGQVSSVRRAVHDLDHLRGCVGVVALLRMGADPEAVAAALAELPGVAEVQRGEAYAAVYRRTGS